MLPKDIPNEYIVKITDELILIAKEGTDDDLGVPWLHTKENPKLIKQSIPPGDFANDLNQLLRQLGVNFRLVNIVSGLVDLGGKQEAIGTLLQKIQQKRHGRSPEELRMIQQIANNWQIIKKKQELPKILTRVICNVKKMSMKGWFLFRTIRLCRAGVQSAMIWLLSMLLCKEGA